MSLVVENRCNDKNCGYLASQFGHCIIRAMVFVGRNRNRRLDCRAADPLERLSIVPGRHIPDSNSHFGTITRNMLWFSVFQPQWVDGNRIKLKIAGFSRNGAHAVFFVIIYM
ncbi:MAG: hypothetical protein U5O69_05320 [Candidatus Competibacteraceae bacterium]|nr:hypothetical protein [Candidatus Competibacteraceae bacterium]